MFVYTFAKFEVNDVIDTSVLSPASLAQIAAASNHVPLMCIALLRRLCSVYCARKALLSLGTVQTTSAHISAELFPTQADRSAAPLS